MVNFLTERGKKKGSTRVLMKYLVLQMPMLLLVIAGLLAAQRYLGLPAWVAWGGSAIWLAKDVLLFPLVRRSYDDRSQSTAHSLTGAKGRAIEMLDNSGYVMIRGVRWKAEVAGTRRSIHKGEPVRVRGCRGLVLHVEPDDLEDTRGGGEQKVAAERFGLPRDGSSP
jgi:membrane protein implicated in regulation of membrane protease activity